MLAGCEPPYVDAKCWLPVLRSDEEVRTLVNVGDGQDRSSNSCPIPVPRVFEVERSYGDVKFEWWGSPHKLYMSATAPDGQRLGIRGEKVEVYENTSGSWLASYSHRIVFSGSNLLDKPASRRLTIEIVGADGTTLDSIDATYDTVECTCPVPDWMVG